jgi:hypothetical protein
MALVGTEHHKSTVRCQNLGHSLGYSCGDTANCGLDRIVADPHRCRVVQECGRCSPSRRSTVRADSNRGRSALLHSLLRIRSPSGPRIHRALFVLTSFGQNSPGRIRTAVKGSKGPYDWPLHHGTSLALFVRPGTSQIHRICSPPRDCAHCEQANRIRCNRRNALERFESGRSVAGDFGLDFEQATDIALGVETVRTLRFAVDDRIEAISDRFVDDTFQLLCLGPELLDL